MSIAEQMFDNMVKEMGWNIHIGGWPDRWIEKDGEVIFIEIKSRNGQLMSNQIETLQMLERLGPAPVRIYCGAGGLESTVTVEEFLRGDGAKLFRPLGPQAVYNYRTEIKKLETFAASLPDGLRKEQVLDLIQRRKAMLPPEQIGKSFETVQKEAEATAQRKTKELLDKHPEWANLSPKATLAKVEQAVRDELAGGVIDLANELIGDEPRKEETPEEQQKLLDEFKRKMEGDTNEGTKATDDVEAVGGTPRVENGGSNQR